MPLMPARLANPWVHKVISDQLDPAGKPNYDDLLRRLDAVSTDQDYAELFLSVRAGDSPAKAKLYQMMIEHLREHWISTGKESFWPAFPERKHILKQAFRKLIELARDRSLPVSVLWVCEEQVKPSFQCAVVANAKSLLLLILTPLVAYDAGGQATEFENIWVFSNEAGALEITSNSRAQGLSAPAMNSADAFKQDPAHNVWTTRVHTVAGPAESGGVSAA